MIFRNRTDAGEQLARRLDFLRAHAAQHNVIVLGIPRGGVVVAFEIARALAAPLDLFFSHKIGAPGNPEFAIGSVSATGDIELDAAAVDALRVPAHYISAEAERQRLAMIQRMKEYRGDLAPVDLENKVIVLVDDGLATGSTALAALKSLRQQRPLLLILAAPVAPPETAERLRSFADKFIVLDTPPGFAAVGQFYDEFGQTSDEEVIALMRKTRLAK
jgi:putative phosphoribosyl transferase